MDKGRKQERQTEARDRRSCYRRKLGRKDVGVRNRADSTVEGKPTVAHMNLAHFVHLGSDIVIHSQEKLDAGVQGVDESYRVGS
jgi:hypothetical protein